ncbi:hypothetical protein FOB22_002885 [Saccharomyces cerevisiae]|nr:hypothetical protein FOB22_002885 [Saccharomyces cerevisiae]
MSKFFKQLETVTSVNFQIKESTDDPTNDSLDFSDVYNLSVQQALINGPYFCSLDYESYLRCTLYRTTASKKDPGVQAELISRKDIKFRSFGVNQCLAFSAFEIFVVNLTPIHDSRELDFTS